MCSESVFVFWLMRNVFSGDGEVLKCGVIDLCV